MFVMLQLLVHGARCQELENVFSIFALQLFYIRVQSSLIGKSAWLSILYIKFQLRVIILFSAAGWYTQMKFIKNYN